ncbi:GNAT family N-acetyltransferase [uncultured Acetatifactor sp.]|uniref:GNAT family N-acetyltransferase n=1 Tax=uncultured Acetatifactor sp. TaxID=1671927 RepID=UPI0026286FC8|nr:GNAT family N-acetyltransferase [uncultured Acetatifactor sp.]
MVYLKEIEVDTEGQRGVLYLTDDAGTARGLREAGEAVLIYLHPGNRDQDFSGFLFAVEDPEDLEPEYIERAYRRLKGLPWNILRTARCLIRETVPEDVESFYQIYSHPAITEYMEGLYPEVEEERQYVRDYIEKVYTFFGFGVWTVVERESGAVIGRAGFSYREGFDEPELGFIIGVPWQRRGYAEEVCRAVLAYGWSALEFRQVQALVEPENIPSVRLCEKLGFRKAEVVDVGKKEYYCFVVRKPY